MGKGGGLLNLLEKLVCGVGGMGGKEVGSVGCGVAGLCGVGCGGAPEMVGGELGWVNPIQKFGILRREKKLCNSAPYPLILVKRN